MPAPATERVILLLLAGWSVRRVNWDVVRCEEGNKVSSEGGWGRLTRSNGTLLKQMKLMLCLRKYEKGNEVDTSDEGRYGRLTRNKGGSAEADEIDVEAEGTSND
jgi:hypothetical protein